jgi:hypothetical protein
VANWLLFVGLVFAFLVTTTTAPAVYAEAPSASGSVVYLDPPDDDDCNDPSDSGPLEPGDCGYEDEGDRVILGEFTLFIPAAFSCDPAAIGGC